jgi:hypothetical protein
MKTNFFYCLLLIITLPILSFTSKPAADDSYYAFIVVDGVWKDGRGYTSKVIHFPGYTNCNRYRDIDFFAEAKRAFSNHLKANYNNAFPYGENNNFQVISFKLHSTSSVLETYEQAQQRLAEWVASQKEEGKQVSYTTFSFSCSNL